MCGIMSVCAGVRADWIGSLHGGSHPEIVQVPSLNIELIELPARSSLHCIYAYTL